MRIHRRRFGVLTHRLGRRLRLSHPVAGIAFRHLRPVELAFRRRRAPLVPMLPLPGNTLVANLYLRFPLTQHLNRTFFSQQQQLGCMRRGRAPQLVSWQLPNITPVALQPATAVTRTSWRHTVDMRFLAATGTHDVAGAVVNRHQQMTLFRTSINAVASRHDPRTAAPRPRHHRRRAQSGTRSVAGRRSLRRFLIAGQRTWLRRNDRRIGPAQRQMDTAARRPSVRELVFVSRRQSELHVHGDHRRVLPVEIVYREASPAKTAPTSSAQRSRDAGTDLPALDVSRLSSEVIRRINKQIRVQRERSGRL